MSNADIFKPKKVDFFIVGAPKCGTTSLSRYLDRHEEIFFSKPKEVNFFSGDEIRNQKLYYQESTVSTLADYESVFSEGTPGNIFGEGSVSYLYYSNVPQKIKNYNTNAKIIIVLRDPVDRAYSHYLMDRRLGYVENEISTIFKNPSKYPVHYQQYFLLGEYYSQVKRYISIFGEKSVLVISDQRFKDTPLDVLENICKFLGIEYQDDLYTEKSHNQFKSPRNFVIAYLYKLHILRFFAQRVIPKVIQDWLKNFLFASDRKPELDLMMKSTLADFYREENEALAALLCEDFPLLWRS